MVADNIFQVSLFRPYAKKGLELKYPQPFSKEFAVAIRDPGAANRALLEAGIITPTCYKMYECYIAQVGNVSSKH